MSHFAVMVAGQDIEELLAPYDENLETEPYLKGEVDDFSSFREHYLKIYPEDSELSDILLYEKYGEDWNSNTWKCEDGKWIEYSTYNPDSKWDWWKVGGRWSGFLKKKGSLLRVDSCLKGEVDVEGMRNETEVKKLAIYDIVHEVLSGLDLTKHISWSTFLEKKSVGVLTIDEARDTYHNQEAVKKFSEFGRSEAGRRIVGWGSEIEPFLVSREEYAQRARENAVPVFAFLDENGWHEKGDMGWWGMVSNEKPDAVWNKTFMTLFEAISDNELVTIVDCHI